MTRGTTSLMALAPLAALVASAQAHADEAYCGRIMCAEAVNGCEVQDGGKNPKARIWAEDMAPRMPKGLHKTIGNLDTQCGCIVGTVAVEKVSKGQGGDYYWFKSISSASAVDEKRCK
jgi:hypothetical protein